MSILNYRKISTGYDYVYNDDPDDVQGHGYRLCRCSCWGNNAGVAGVCWDCSIMPVKVLGDDGYGDDATIELQFRKRLASNN